MKRRELLSRACGMGMCSCAGPLILDESCSAAQENNTDSEELQKLQKELSRKQWWLNHAAKQLAKLWVLLEPELDDTKRREILEQLGRNCAKSIGWSQKFIGNPEGFFNYVNQKNGETFTYDKENGIITVVTRERDCDCQLVDTKITPAYFCHCSMGWQKQMYETIFGKAVDTELKESVLGGSKRCVFEVRIRDKKIS